MLKAILGELRGVKKEGCYNQRKNLSITDIKNTWHLARGNCIYLVTMDDRMRHGVGLNLLKS